MIPLAPLLANPLVRKVALYGAAGLALFWVYRIHTNRIAEEAEARGAQKQAVRSAEAFDRVQAVERKKLAEERATVVDAQGVAAADRRSAELAREKMRQELVTRLGALREDLRRGNDAALQVPGDQLDAAIRAALEELRPIPTGGAPVGDGKAGAPRPTP